MDIKYLVQRQDKNGFWHNDYINDINSRWDVDNLLDKRKWAVARKSELEIKFPGYEFRIVCRAIVEFEVE